MKITSCSLGIVTVLVAMITATQVGCGSSAPATGTAKSIAYSSSTLFLPPRVTPIVNSALPASLQSTLVPHSAAELLKKPTYAKAIAPTLKTAHHKTTKLSIKDQVKTSQAQSETPHVRAAGDTISNSAATAAVTDIQDFFNDYVANLSGSGYIKGYLPNQLMQIDSRLSSLVSTTSPPWCVSLPPQSYNFNGADGTNLGAIDPILNFTLNQVQCYSITTGGTTGGGTVFGQSNGCILAQPSPNPSVSPSPNPSPSPIVVTAGGCNYSMWMSMGQTTGFPTAAGGWIIAANINNAGSTNTALPQAVDALIMNYGPASGSNVNTISIFRLKAIPSTNSFEFYLAANNEGMADALTHVPYYLDGMRMISNGTLIYADGYVSAPNSGDYTGASGWQSHVHFQVCMNASDLSLNTTSGACTTLYGQFSIPSPSATAAPSTTFNECEITGATPYADCATSTNAFASNGLLSGPQATTTLLPVSQKVVNAFAAVFPVTNASPVSIPMSTPSPTPSAGSTSTP